MYITYNEYMMMDGELDQDIFDRLEAKARNLIDSATFGRLTQTNEVSKSVKYCMFELIDSISQNEANADPQGREIASMSNDGVTVSYSSNGGAQARYKAIIREWLAGETDVYGVPLFYAGVMVR